MVQTLDGLRGSGQTLGAMSACAGSFDPAEMQAVLVGDPALIRAQVQGPLREVAAGGSSAR